ncbi:uncharacterized protein LOC114434459 isoform X2 [Parambassis ranga]|uniref:Uncharacterized protein LOC114434459 isoform X2 n=1 Tax=Parambassis ranga TaxID=210632 RepID=A0A6P7IGQ1_9TELE|nr:uncharacterized protein LOC114434459 isoform X2 [Parambassis ranga]
MDDYTSKLRENSLNYKNTLNRIIEKYSKLQGNEEEGIEVDLDNVNTKRLQQYITLSRKKLNKLEPKGLTDSREETLMGQAITGDSLLDFTYQDGRADETSTSQNAGLSRNDMTRLTVSSLDESRRNSPELEFQPEDQDEELQLSLSSHSSSLLELYPSMISRINRAWERQHISTAANSVLKRYRRWRQQSNRSYLSDTFNVSRRHNSSPEKVTSKALSNDISQVERKFVSAETSLPSPLPTVTNLHDWKVQQLFPGKERVSSVRRQQYHPALFKDFRGPFNSSEALLNKTYTTSELGEQASGYTDSLSKPSRESMDSFFRARRFSLSALSGLDKCPVNSSETTAVSERSDIYGSPVRQSPLKAKMLTSFNRSPRAFYRSPREDSLQGYSRGPVQSRSLSTSMSSPQRPLVLLRKFCNQNLPSTQRSPQSTTAAHSRHRLRRHLSFDSALPSNPVAFSPKKVDEDFMRVYHKFACQNKSGPPCRLCAQSSEDSRGHSSSSLAALALSPHRSILRKRHRGTDGESHPHSKRLREEYCMSSPGSKRHGKELLVRLFSPSGLEVHRYNYNTFERFQHSRRGHM